MERKRFRVYVSSYRNVYGYADVEAENEDDAADAVGDYDFVETIEWEENGDIEDTEISEIREINPTTGVVSPYISSRTPLTRNKATGYDGTELMLR